MNQVVGGIDSLHRLVERSRLEAVTPQNFGIRADSLLQKFWFACQAPHSVPVGLERWQQSATDITRGAGQQYAGLLSH